MQNIKLNSHVGSDGILHLDVPIDIKNAKLEVIITVKHIDSIQENKEKSEWSPEFFEKTAGAWEGNPLERESQGEYENREELF
jgi:hypothetical protein